MSLHIIIQFEVFISGILFFVQSSVSNHSFPEYSPWSDHSFISLPSLNILLSLVNPRFITTIHGTGNYIILHTSFVHSYKHYGMFSISYLQLICSIRSLHHKNGYTLFIYLFDINSKQSHLHF